MLFRSRQLQLEKTLGAYEQKARASALQILKANNMLPLDSTPEQQAQLVNDLAAQNLASDPTYNKLYKEIFGFTYSTPTTTTAKPTVGQYDSTYKLTPNPRKS